VLLLGYAAAAAFAPAGVDWRGFFEGWQAAALSAFSLAYFFAMEAAFGQTLGKAVCDVRVVDRRQQPASAGRVALRTVLRCVDNFLGGLVGLICIMATGPGQRQRVGDAAAGTYVVRASQVPLPRALEGTIALAGIALALLPALLAATPGGESLWPRSERYAAKQVATRYINAAVAGDGAAACAAMSAGERRAVVASATGQYAPAGTSVADCAPHAKVAMARDAGTFGAVGGGTLIAQTHGNLGVAGPRATQLVLLVREEGSWHVDPLATGRAGFMSGCTPGGPPNAKQICTCIWDEMRGNGVESIAQLSAISQRLDRNDLPAWMTRSARACGAPGA
jgi:uncharacterized RDD family membrane protein YckC